MTRGSRGWNDADRALALALVAYEDSVCPCGCGWTRDKAWDPESDGWAVVREQVCYAGAARDRWQREHDKPDSTEPGTLLLVVDERDEPTGADD